MEAEANRTMPLCSCLNLRLEGGGQLILDNLSFGSEIENWSSYYNVNEKEALSSPRQEHGFTYGYADLASSCFQSLTCSPGFFHVGIDICLLLNELGQCRGLVQQKSK